MKKILLFLVLTSLNLVAQTPIWHYAFDGNSSPVNPQGNYGGSLFKVSGGTTNASNFGVDRFGNSGSSLIVKFHNDFLYYANLANLPQGNNPRSFSFWVRIKHVADQRFFLYGGTTNSDMFGMSIPTLETDAYISTAGTISTLFRNTLYPRYVSTNSSDDNAWIHYTVTADATETKIYKNGVLMDTRPITLTTSGTNIKFGLPYLDSNTAFYSVDFLLDDFKIYNQVLTHAQIKQMYADEVAFNPTNLVAYYGFENNLDCTNDVTYNLTAQNPAENTYETGIIGQSRRLQFNPVYNDVIGANINNGSFTIMAWEKLNEVNLATDYATTIEYGASTYVRRRTNNFYNGYAYSSTQFLEKYIAGLGPQYTWVHHTLTVKMIGGTFHLVYYRNGELLSITDAPTNAATSVYTFINKFVLGGGTDASGNILTNKRVKDINIDEVYVYNRVLDQSEILATMYRTSTPTTLSNTNFELKEISLYPNPTNSIFTVEVPNDSVKTISVVDVMGKVVTTSNVATVEVSNLASGIYVVKVETISGKTGTQKLVKN